MNILETLRVRQSLMGETPKTALADDWVSFVSDLWSGYRSQSRYDLLIKVVL